MSTSVQRTASGNGQPLAVNFERGRSPEALRSIALLGTFPPRQCGIATYTADVLRSLQGACPQAGVFAIAVNKGEAPSNYPAEVEFEVSDNSLESYRAAAAWLTERKPDVLCVQHEYGIFGGEAGSHLFELLERCPVPVVTVMHTVLEEPGPDIREATLRLLKASDRVIVMTRLAADLVRKVYGAAGTPLIDIIPHGIPDIPLEPTTDAKVELGLEGRFVLMTFGLLSPGKGIEYAIDAMPEIVRKDPAATYVILGATHPCLIEREGEAYRESLLERARRLGVGEHVLFVNSYVDIGLLTRYLRAADVYVTPYLNEAQITSGTLAYASGSGRPVVSTPYWHARELVTPERGFIVPFRDSGAISDAVCRLLADDSLRDALRRNAWEHGRESIWSEVGRGFARSFAATAFSSRFRQRTEPLTDSAYQEPETGILLFPFTPCQDHLRSMITPLGIWQHAQFREPNRSHGFCTDDNARLLLLGCQLPEREAGAQDWREIKENCFRFLEEAWNPVENQFRNFRHADGRWLEKTGSPDSNGRTLWACGVLAATPGPQAIRARAAALLRKGISSIREGQDLRPGAFAALGLAALPEEQRGEEPLFQEALRRICGRLRNALSPPSADGWRWFEEHLTYDNARLPHALIEAGRVLGDNAAIVTGVTALRWLMEHQTAVSGHFRPIGCHGWLRRGEGKAAQFDQQPLEAWASVSACLAARRVTGDVWWEEAAGRAYRWFLGENDLGLPLYESANGGVYDGLHPLGVNRNQGAESVLAFHLSHWELAAAGNLRQSGSAAEKPAALASL